MWWRRLYRKFDILDVTSRYKKGKTGEMNKKTYLTHTSRVVSKYYVNGKSDGKNNKRYETTSYVGKIV